MAMTRELAARRLYGGGAQGAGSIDAAIAAYHDRWLARRGADDAEARTIARQERTQLEAFAKKRGISPADLGDALNVLLEREAFPNSPEAIAARREQTREALRLELGGVDQADAHIKRYVSVTSALAKEVPTLAARANATGAGEDPRVINALVKYGDQPQEK